jgi:hypothetical protein
VAAVAKEETTKVLTTGNANGILVTTMIPAEIEPLLINARQSMRSMIANTSTVTATAIRTTGSENVKIRAPIDTAMITKTSDDAILGNLLNMNGPRLVHPQGSMRKGSPRQISRDGDRSSRVTVNQNQK